MKRVFPIVCVGLVAPLVVLGLASGGRGSGAAPLPSAWGTSTGAAPVFGPEPRVELQPAFPPAVLAVPPAAAAPGPAMGGGVPAMGGGVPAMGGGVPVMGPGDAVPSPPSPLGAGEMARAPLPPAPANTPRSGAVGAWDASARQLPESFSQPGRPSNSELGNPDPLAAWGPAPAPLVDPRRFTEAHWQGLEVVPRTQALAEALNLPVDARGVVVDDASLPADLQGFQAGDLVAYVGATATPDLLSFVQASGQVRDQPKVDVVVLRRRQYRTLVLTALMDRLGTANGETPPMIQPGSAPPHAYHGPCTNCHRIGQTGQMAIDQGDLFTKAAPAIRAGVTRPHRDWGTCSTCHQIAP